MHTPRGTRLTCPLGGTKLGDLRCQLPLQGFFLLSPGFPNMDTKLFGLGDVCNWFDCNLGLWSVGDTWDQLAGVSGAHSSQLWSAVSRG